MWLFIFQDFILDIDIDIGIGINRPIDLNTHICYIYMFIVNIH